MKKLSKILAVALSLILLLEVLPTQLLATALDADQSAAETETVQSADLQDEATAEEPDEAAEEKTPSEIIGEDESLRTEDTKHFRRKDGSYVAAVYPAPVHYAQNGKWQDIDNTLITAKDARGKDAYKNKNGNLQVNIPKEMASGEKLTLQSGAYTIGFGALLDNATQKSAAKLTDVKALPSEALQREETDAETKTTALTRAEEVARENEEKTVLEKLSSAVRYENVFPDADLEYVISSTGIKENVVVNSAQNSYVYRFEMDLAGLVPLAQEDGSIWLAESADADEPIFVLEAPYMYDANGVYSNAVQMSIATENGKSILTLEADKEWVNAEERAFPVVIDPTIDIGPSDAAAIKDTYVSTLFPNTNYKNATKLYAGKTIIERNRTYIQFALPLLPDCSVVTDAEFRVRKAATSLSGVRMFAYDCGLMDTWDWESITWNNQPAPKNANDCKNQEDIPLLDYDTGAAIGSTVYKFNITQAVANWYNGKAENPYYDYNGILLTTENESSNNQIDMFSANYGTASDRPVLALTYVNNTGLEDYWTYETVDLGRSGAAYVNHYNGRMVYIHNDLSMSGNRMPLHISHIFNSTKANLNGTYSNMSLGHGFRLNILEEINEVASGSAQYTNGYRYEFVDGDGTLHYFMATPVNNKFVYEYSVNNRNNSTEVSMADWYLLKNSNGSITMCDDQGNTKLFQTVKSGETVRRLVSIADANGNQQVIQFTNGRITSVTDGANRSATFSYDANGYLTKITDPAGREILFVYTQVTSLLGMKSLEKVVYPDGTETAFTYMTPNALVLALLGNSIKSVTAADGSDLQLSYEPYATQWLYYGRVISLERRGVPDETTGARETADELSFSYLPGNTQIANADGDREDTYLFDSSGRTVNERDKEGGASFTFYNTGGNTNNKPQKSSYWQTLVENLLKNSSFEANATGWTRSSNDGALTEGRSTTYAEIGSYSQWIKRTTPGSAYLYQNFSGVEAEESYTLSAWLNIPQAMTGEGAKVTLQAWNGNTFLEESHSELLLTTDGEWKRLSTSLTVPANATQLRCHVRMDDSYGTFYADGIQLEKGDTAKSYNLLENSGFRYTTSNLPDSWIRSNFESGDIVRQNAIGKNYVGVFGNPDKQKQMTQTVKISGKAGETVTFGGLSTSSPSGRDYTTRVFEVRLLIKYTDGTQAVAIVPFNRDVQQLQMMAGSYTLTKSCNEITFYFTYFNQVNWANFDNAFLYLENFGSSYGYDAYGRLSYEAYGDGEVDTYTYTGSNLTKVTTTKNGVEQDYTQYTYDNNHNLKKSQTKDGIITEYFYGANNNAANTFGFVTKVRCSNTTDNKVTESSMAYTGNYNYVASETDERGNVTSYTYNNNTGLLTSVTDPKGRTTSYQYDADTDAVTQKTYTAGGTTVGAVNYAYTGDLLQSITRNNMSYSFEYDNLHRVTNTKVGSQSLAANSYDLDGNLQRMTYGNGQYYEPVYDDLDRVVQEQYNGVVKYTYTYNESDVLTRITDNESGQVWDYQYDTEGQLVALVGDNGVRVEFGYDANGAQNSLIFKRNGVVVSQVGYTYTEDDMPDKVLLHTGDEGFVQYAYDSIARLTEQTHTIQVAQPNTKVHTAVQYEVADGNETGLVAQLTHEKLNGSTVSSTYYDWEYEYDETGNITKIYDSGTLKVSYAYDGLDQLLREDNLWLNKSITYSYNAGGNLTSKKEYAYTTGTLGSATSTDSYTYGDSNWTDKLTKFNNKSITYDAIGNPLTYDGYTYTWQKGRQLQSITGNSLNLSFAYNADGLRTKKINGSTTTQYSYVGSLLMSQTDGTNTLDFMHDEAGSAVSVRFAGNNYYYLYNLQGDVVALYNNSGAIVCKYTYDSWGKLVSVKDANGGNISSATHIANLNPLRYRGYYYDIETQWYYLQSRYYNPQWRRFISADAYCDTDTGIVGTNMFAYCDNNPVNSADYTGFASKYNLLETTLLTYVSGAVAEWIVGHWLVGGGKKLTIKNNKTWNDYLIKNKKIKAHLIAQIKSAFKKKKQAFSGHLDNFSISESGRGGYRTGYDLINGVNKKYGGFDFNGAVDSQNSLYFILKGSFAIHDYVDPNPQYREDVFWSKFFKKTLPKGHGMDYELEVVCYYSLKIYWKSI